MFVGVEVQRKAPEPLTPALYIEARRRAIGLMQKEIRAMKRADFNAGLKMLERIGKLPLPARAIL
jgi:hypothetical protein